MIHSALERVKVEHPVLPDLQVDRTQLLCRRRLGEPLPSRGLKKKLRQRIARGRFGPDRVNDRTRPNPRRRPVKARGRGAPRGHGHGPGRRPNRHRLFGWWRNARRRIEKGRIAALEQRLVTMTVGTQRLKVRDGVGRLGRRPVTRVVLPARRRKRNNMVNVPRHRKLAAARGTFVVLPVRNSRTDRRRRPESRRTDHRHQGGGWRIYRKECSISLFQNDGKRPGALPVSAPGRDG